MYQIFIGSLILSTIHALIPNHWLPLIVIGKTEKWTTKQTLSATVITGTAHTLSTIIIGIVVGLIGYRLAASYASISETIAPLILIFLGVIYLFLDFRHQHHHSHEMKDITTGIERKTSRWTAILTSLSIAMFLTPCVEIEVYYFQAGTIGWPGITVVSAVYLFITVVIMLLLVYWGMKGVKTLRFSFLEHHEKMITGMVLIGLGILALWIRF
ncbi:MAG: hypothetical protein NTU44_01965 [Bacteroidetes bacterium]|nr:hypothetical protein [Bacteroidota bacterium]